MELDMEVEILGQQPDLQVYTQLSSVFRLQPEVQVEDIEAKLRKGLHQLAKDFPWIAGQIVQESTGRDGSGVFKIRPFHTVPRFVVQDARSDGSMPSLDDMAAAGYPMSMFDESKLAPRMTIPGGPGETAADPVPVFMVQLTLIPGGVVLTSATVHRAFDIIGHAQVLHWLSQACHGIPCSDDDKAIGNMERRCLIPLLDDSSSDLEGELGSLWISPPRPPAAAPAGSPPPPCSWATMRVSSEELARLKADASRTVTAGFVSTDDALTALIWQAVMRARQHRVDPGRDVKMTRAVDVRSHCSLPGRYPGLMQSQVVNACRLGELLEAPLGVVAARLRARLDPARTLREISGLATMLERDPDKSRYSFVASTDSAVDINLSSWAKADCYGDDFNLGLGRPVTVIRPQFPPYEGLIYLMPRSAEGAIAVTICLRNDEVERLRTDEELNAYVQFVG